MTRRFLLAGVVLIGLAECAFWALTAAFAWAFRDFILCWTQAECAARSSIVATRTVEAAAFSAVLALNLVALGVFLANRQRPGLLVLSALQVVDLAITVVYGAIFAASSEWVTMLQSLSGGFLAALLLGLLYVLNGLPAAMVGVRPRTGRSPAPGGE